MLCIVVGQGRSFYKCVFTCLSACCRTSVECATTNGTRCSFDIFLSPTTWWRQSDVTAADDINIPSFSRRDETLFRSVTSRGAPRHATPTHLSPIPRCLSWDVRVVRRRAARRPLTSFHLILTPTLRWRPIQAYKYRPHLLLLDLISVWVSNAVANSGLVGGRFSSFIVEKSYNIFHLWIRRGNILSRVCLCDCLSRSASNFWKPWPKTSFLVCRWTFRMSRSGSRIKVTGSRSYERVVCLRPKWNLVC